MKNRVFISPLREVHLFSLFPSLCPSASLREMNFFTFWLELADKYGILETATIPPSFFCAAAPSRDSLRPERTPVPRQTVPAFSAHRAARESMRR
jgi:hypothetical protein